MQQNAEKQIVLALGKFKQARDWLTINGCLQNIKEICSNYQNDFYDSQYKLQIAKTLSQCLSPSLPAGVQSNALDVYHIIFEIAGETRLLRDFYIWSPGLLQFFHSAGVAQRASALKLFNDFFIPLIPKNHRIGPPIILSILPGLTDDGTEVKSLDDDALMTIKKHLGIKHFWKSMFRAAITNSLTRSAFLIFANKSDPTEFSEIENDELIVSLFTVLFHDQNILVLRSSLELLISCFPIFKKEIQNDLSLKCINLLPTNDQSIRRRVFNFIKTYYEASIKVIGLADPESIKIAIAKGDKIKNDIISNCLHSILNREDFNVPVISSISQYINVDVLLNASKDNIDAQFRVVQATHPSEDAKFSILIQLLNYFLNDNSNYNIITLVSFLLYLFDNINFENKISDELLELATKVSNSIFQHYTNNKECFQLVSKLISTLSVRPDFSLLTKNSFSSLSIDFLIKISQENIFALLALDHNAYNIIAFYWKALKQKPTSYSSLTEISQHLVELYHLYSPQFTLSINENWDKESVIIFIRHTTEIPFSLIAISINKNDYEILRMINGYAQLILADIKRLISNDDYEFTKNVLIKLQYLIDVDRTLFASSIADGSMIEFIKLLISTKGTSNLLFSILSKISSNNVLSGIASHIEKFILSDLYNEWAYRLISFIAPFIQNVEPFINAIPTHHAILNPIICLLDNLPPSENHYHYIETTCQKCVELLSKNPIDESLLFDISKLFAIIIKRSENEVFDLRASMKSSTLRRILTSVEDLSSDDCVASLSAIYMPDYTPKYISIAPKYLPSILTAICNGFDDFILSSKFIVSLFASFDSTWKLLIFYSLSITTNQKTIESVISSILPLLQDDQLLSFIKSLIQILSYDEKEKTPFCNLIEALLQYNSSVFLLSDFIPLLTLSFTSLHLTPSNVVKIILEYQAHFPDLSLAALNSSFLNSINECKSNQDEVQKILSFLCSMDNQEIIKTFYSHKAINVLSKVLLSCDKQAIQYPVFISKFCSFDPEGLDWTNLIIGLLSDQNFFANTIDYLSAALEAVKSVIKCCQDKMIPMIFEMLSKPDSIWRSSDGFGEIRKLNLLSFIILSCENDFFASRQQNINAQLVQFLAFDIPKDNKTAKMKAFKAFSLFMRVIFIRFSQKILESFLSTINNELIIGFTSDDDNIRAQAEILTRSAIMAIPASFQFSEFAFIPDLITFENNNDLKDKVWPILKESSDSLLHLSYDPFNKNKFEADLLKEFYDTSEVPMHSSTWSIPFIGDFSPLNEKS